MSNLRQRLICNQNWNIGFCEITPEELWSSKGLGKITWMKNPYKDRWFADPFILKVTKETITLFVEERRVLGDKGYLTELVIDRNSYEIKERYILLEIESHLSYPAILKRDGSTYVYPENALGGPLKMYEYDESNHKLINPRIILDERVADSTMIRYEGKYYIIATKYPESPLKNAFLFVSDTFDGPFTQVGPNPVQSDMACSRPGGNWFVVNDNLYRPAQNCVKKYGGALEIMKIESMLPFKEEVALTIEPVGFKYNLGIHTINFSDGVAVVDGYGYLYPMVGRIYYSRAARWIIERIKRCL